MIPHRKNLSKSFETVNREKLLRKLNRMGVTGTVLKWFESYVTERYQRVKFKNCISETLLIADGVPQGTVLGPLLFLNM